MEVENCEGGCKTRTEKQCQNCSDLDTCVLADQYKNHWIKWPDHWEHTSDIRGPMLQIFHPTGVRSYNPETGLYHWWQSRANRKQVPHRQHFRFESDRMWWTYCYSWKPTVFAWWVALSFTFGSMIFVTLAALLLNPEYEEDDATSKFMKAFALSGSLIFVFGGTCQVLEVLQAPLVITEPYLANLSVSSGIKRRDSLELSLCADVEAEKQPSPPDVDRITVPSKNGFDVLNDKDVDFCERICFVFGEWRRIDLTAAWIQWIGTLLFVVHTFGTSGIWWATHNPDISWRLFIGVTVAPDIAASCTFIIAGWLHVIEASHCWCGFHPRNIGWVAGMSSTLGGMGFLANAVTWYYVQGGFVASLTLLLGSLFFLLGSTIAWIEQSQ